MDELSALRYIMSVIVTSCQHCDEQQFQTLSCVHDTIFSLVNLDLFIHALTLNHILALKKTTRMPRVHLVCCGGTLSSLIGIENFPLL